MKRINSYSISLEGVTELLTFEGEIVFTKLLPITLSIRIFIESEIGAEQIKRAFKVVTTQPYDGQYVGTIQGKKYFQIYHLVELPLSVSQSPVGKISAKAESIDGCVETTIEGINTINGIEQSKVSYDKPETWSPLTHFPLNHNPSNQHNHLSAAQVKDRFDTMRKAIEP